MDQIYMTATTSSSHIFGNISSAMQMYVKNHLPEGFLKDSSISTRTVFKHYKQPGIDKENRNILRRRQKPCLIVRPSFDIISATDDAFLNGTHYTRNEGTIIGSKSGIQNFFNDKQRSIGMGFRINRYRILFDFSVVVETQYQALDLYHYLNNTFKWELAEYIPTSLESLIPRNLISTVGSYIGVDTDKSENTKTMLDYLQTHSSYPITYMMRNSTANDEYFLYYPQNILTFFQDLSLEEGEKKGMIDDSYIVSFKASCEFNVMGSYFLYGTKNIFDKIQLCIHLMNSKGAISNKAYTPLYTYDILTEDINLITRGFTKYCNAIVKTDVDKDGMDDSFSIKNYINSDDYAVYLQQLSQGNDIKLLFDLRMVRNNLDMKQDVSWDIDWDKLKVTIHNSDKFSTYRFFLYVNLAYLNNHKLDIEYPKTDQQTIDSNSSHGYTMD